MRLIARQIIKGITNDADLLALDAIMYFEAKVDTADKVIAVFEAKNPDFTNCDYEVFNGYGGVLN